LRWRKESRAREKGATRKGANSSEYIRGEKKGHAIRTFGGTIAPPMKTNQKREEARERNVYEGGEATKVMRVPHP